MQAKTVPTIADLAAEAAAYFTRIQRADETITTTRDDAPEWVTDLVHEAHGDFLPDDWRYATIKAALDAISETEADNADELDDRGAEFADETVDVYTGRRLAWLASNLNRVSYCDEAAEEFGDPSSFEDNGIVARIGWGQYMEAQEVWASVVQSLADEMEARDES